MKPPQTIEPKNVQTQNSEGNNSESIQDQKIMQLEDQKRLEEERKRKAREKKELAQVATYQETIEKLLKEKDTTLDQKDVVENKIDPYVPYNEYGVALVRNVKNAKGSYLLLPKDVDVNDLFKPKNSFTLC